MKIISFGMTAAPVEAQVKTVTRRAWTHNYADQFNPGEFVWAYDKSQRVGGKPIAIIRILSVDWDYTSDMPLSDYQAEGLAFMSKHGIKTDFKYGTSLTGFKQWQADNESLYVVRFEYPQDAIFTDGERVLSTVNKDSLFDFTNNSFTATPNTNKRLQTLLQRGANACTTKELDAILIYAEKGLL